MGNYVKCERETIIRWDDETGTAIVNTFSRGMQRKVEKLLKEYPDDVKLKKDYAEDDYDGIHITLPKSWIKIRAPRKMTDEQRKTLSDRASAMRVNSKATKSL